ncbi:hypothetical protein DFJ73DRAFT_964287 [Zopfochytrium polystomum]|nr:hypothetical protein DFJ73DRAFT_964287 [Zopfochytrium polystomum]
MLPPPANAAVAAPAAPRSFSAATTCSSSASSSSSSSSSSPPATITTTTSLTTTTTASTTQYGAFLPLWRIVALASAMCGIQFAWSVIQSYGTPYLISLGMPKPWIALVWLAGPVSGLLVQPIVGVYSDQCRLAWGRRKPFIAGGGILMLAALLPIAYSRELALLVAATDQTVVVQSTSIAFAVLGFVVLDFSINAVMTATRALIVDAVALRQQNDAFVWASRMAGFGNCFGDLKQSPSYFTGFVNLTSLFSSVSARFPVLLGTQLKMLCAVCGGCLTATLLLAVAAVRDGPAPPARRPRRRPRRARTALRKCLRRCFRPLVVVFKAMRRLPGAMRNVCYVQFFAWLGFFPFLFYSSAWVGSRLPPRGDDDDTGGGADDDRTTDATRAGALALLLNSLLSLAATVVIPAALARASAASTSSVWRKPSSSGAGAAAAAARHRILSTPGVWAASLALFGALMLATWTRPGLLGATAVVGMCGISWGSVVQWVPFSLVAEYVTFYADGGTDADMDAAAAPSVPRWPATRAAATPPRPPGDAAAGPGEALLPPRGPTTVPSMTAATAATATADGLTATPTSSATPLIAPCARGRPLAAEYQSLGGLGGAAAADGGTEWRPSCGGGAADDVAPAPAPAPPPPPPPALDMDAGVVLGILNIYVVVPQFLSTLLTSVVFWAVERGGNGGGGGLDHVWGGSVVGGGGGGDGGEGSGLEDPRDSFGWCLRLGVIPSFVAAYWAWRYVREVGDGFGRT